MNAGISKRVVGFAVLVVVVLAVLLFLPRPGTPPQQDAIPVAAVPIGKQGPLDTTPAPAAEGEPSAQDTSAPAHPQTAPAVTASPAPSTVWKDAVPREPAVESAPPAAVEKTPAAEPAAPAASTPAVKRPASAPRAPAAPQGRFYIQVASFSDAANASAALQKLRGIGFRGTTDTTRLNGKTWTRVQVGPYADRASAEAAQARLKAQGYGGSRVLSR